MNETQSWMRGVLAIGVVLGIASAGLAQPAAIRVAKVIRVEGNARYSVDGGASFHPLAVGTVLKPGSQLATAKGTDAYVDVVLGDGSTPIPGYTSPAAGAGHGAGGGGSGYHNAAGEQDMVRLIGTETSATLVGFDKLAATETGEVIVTETELNLKSGRIVGNVKKMTAGSSYNIRYANGVVSIRGSVYDMTIVEGLVNGKVTIDAIVNMQSGSASVTFKDDQGNTLSQMVLPLQSLNTGTGAVGQIPPELLVQIGDLLAAMGVPPVLVARIITSDQTTVQFLTNTGGGKTGP